MKKIIIFLIAFLLLANFAHAQSPRVLTVDIGGTGASTLSGCLQGNGTGPITGTGLPCSFGGGGSAGGTWGTTTSSVASQLLNYSNNTTDIAIIGGYSTSTSKFSLDPNTNVFNVLSGKIGVGTTSPYASISANGRIVGNVFTADSALSTSTFLGKMFIGTNTTSGDDSSVLIGRAVTGVSNTHGFRDESTVDASVDAGGYSAFDSKYTYNGTSAYNHMAGFQARQVYNGSNSLNEWRGFWSSPSLTGTGAVTNIKNFHVLNSTNTGGGSVANQYGVFIEGLTAGTASNYAIYTMPSTPSWFSGQIDIGTTSAQTGANTNDGHLSLRGASGNQRFMFGYNTTLDYGWMQAAKFGTAFEPIAINPNGGNVSIGTSTFVAKLAVAGGTTNTSGAVKINPAGTGNNATLNVTGNGLEATLTNTGATTTLIFQPAGGNVGIGTTSPYRGLSVAGGAVVIDNVLSSYFVATSTTLASTFPYASTTAISATTLCLTGDICRTTWPTGGSGGGSGGTWSTTTSSVAGQLLNYPNNATDIVNIGSNSTTTAEVYFDPNMNQNKISGNTSLGYHTLCGNAQPLASSTGSVLLECWGDSATNVEIGVGNRNNSTTAYTDFFLNNDLADSTITHYAALYLNSSTYNDTTYGTGQAFANQLGLQNTDGLVSIFSSTSTATKNGINFYVGGTNTTNEIGRFTTTGLGIGTTSPYRKLSVAGNAVVDDNIRSSYFTATSTTATSAFSGPVTVSTITANSSSNTALNTSGSLQVLGGNISAGAAHDVWISAANTVTKDFTVKVGGLIGIGNSSPRYPLEVGTISTALNTLNGSVTNAGFSSATRNVLATEYTGASGATAGAFLGAYSNDGASMASGDRLGGFFFGGYDGTNMRNSGMIHSFATEAWSATNAGTNLVFATTPNGSVTRTDRMTIDSNGGVSVGTTTATAKLNIYGGGVIINPGATGKPTCDVSQRGNQWNTFSGAGVKDSAEVCLKDAADAYAWRTLY